MTPEPILNETAECSQCARSFDADDVSIKYDRVFCQNCERLDYLTLMVGITRNHVEKIKKENAK